MRPRSVIIKSCAYGLIILLDHDLPFDLLCWDVAEKFREAARFFRNAQMAVSFKGRELTEEQERELVGVICENSHIQIVCIVDESRESSDYYKEAVVRALESTVAEHAAVYFGSISPGQTLESENSLVILGDVPPGASVCADGSVIILGRCMGQVTAGYSGYDEAFVAALLLKPSFLRIASSACRSAITKKEDDGAIPNEPAIAYLKDDHFVMEPLEGENAGSGSVFEHLKDRIIRS